MVGGVNASMDLLPANELLNFGGNHSFSLDIGYSIEYPMPFITHVSYHELDYGRIFKSVRILIRILKGADNSGEP